MEHKWCKNGPKTPQNYIVHPMLVPVVSYFISYPAFKCLQAAEASIRRAKNSSDRHDHIHKAGAERKAHDNNVRYHHMRKTQDLSAGRCYVHRRPCITPHPTPCSLLAHAQPDTHEYGCATASSLHPACLSFKHSTGLAYPYHYHKHKSQKKIGKQRQSLGVTTPELPPRARLPSRTHVATVPRLISPKTLCFRRKRSMQGNHHSLG